LSRAFLPDFGDNQVVLSDKPAVLTADPTHFSSTAPVMVLGFSSDLCFGLAR